jgi:hypothetical protein
MIVVPRVAPPTGEIDEREFAVLGDAQFVVLLVEHFTVDVQREYAVTATGMFIYGIGPRCSIAHTCNVAVI